MSGVLDQSATVGGAPVPSSVELLVGSWNPGSQTDVITHLGLPPVRVRGGHPASVLAWARGENGVLYAAEAHRVSAWRFRGETLELLDDHPMADSLPCHLALTADGAHVVVAHYESGEVSVHPTLPDGALHTASDVHQLVGRGADAERQMSPHPHMVVCRQNEIIIADLGTDQLHRFVLVAGRLVETTTVKLPPGTGPRHLVVRGDTAYVVGELTNELLTVDLATDTVVDITSCSDVSARVGEDRYPSGILLSPDGRHCHVLVRGPDTIATFELDPTPALIHETSTGGAWPWDLVLVDDTLYVAHQHSGTVTSLRIPADTCRPESAVTVAVIPHAVSLVRAPSPTKEQM